MAATFTADSEHPVDESIFPDLHSATADNAAPAEEHQSDGTAKPITQAEAEAMGLDDGRTPLQKRLDGDVPPKKKDKVTKLVDLLMATSKEKKERPEQRNASAEERFLKRFEFKVQNHTDNHEIQMKDMSLRKRELKLRETEAEIRRLELMKQLNEKS
ncbi:hypothetical protein RvY_10848 [Ramazzottius varieornatus]|uniref:Uncharacterized protein n=1 Tax=Ramazzottius varieornatus TaxID=947166 RepID=A0A1D1VLX8_RAMVA|nr:hypothetical protein RvY_10848 [Ramazzottius varieornatus]